MSFSLKDDRLTDIDISGELIKYSESTKFLGLWIDDKLNWNKHCNILITKLKQNLSLLQISKNVFNQSILKFIYHAHIQSHINYGLVIWGGMVSKETLNSIQRIQTKCLKQIKKNSKLSKRTQSTKH